MHPMDGGAEALIYLTEAEGVRAVLKDRCRKTYRIPEIDEQLRTSRTKREMKILQKLPIAGPKPLFCTDTTITMSFVEGKRLRDVLDKNPLLAEEAGCMLAALHDAGIIHGDPTTSNMIYDEHTGKLSFIDFGLSLFSQKLEDKAVDVHLLRCALESKHTSIWKQAFAHFLEGYAKSSHAAAVLDRFAKVEQRGRNKEKT